MARVVILSLRFNPAFLQFLTGFAMAVRELGYEPAFLLDPAYCQFTKLGTVAPVYDLDTISQAGRWTHALFLNPAVENRGLAAKFKKEATRVLYLFHEPWQFSLDYLLSEGLGPTVRAALAHHATVPVLRLADTVMVPSRYGLRIYGERDIRFNRSAVYFPLILDDEVSEEVASLLPRKRYCAFIGNPCRAHGFDQYTSFMHYGLAHRRDLQFLVASRFPLPPSFTRNPLVLHNADKVEIRCGRPLSDDEINLAYAESFCVWNLYRRSTQSAVLPKAYMFGSPVIASRIGSFPEFVQDGVNGRFAQGDDPEGILNAAEDMRENLTAYSISCRKMFHEVFFYKARLNDLRQLLG